MTDMLCIKCHRDVPDGPYCCLCGQNQSKPIRSTRKRTNGTGTAFKRGSTWTAQRTLYITIDDEGKQHRKYQTKGGFATKRDAILWLENLAQKQKKTAPKLIELWTVYEKSKFPKLSKGKKMAYRKARSRLDPIMGIRIDQLTTMDLQRAVDETCSTYYTARDCKTLLSHLYESACADQFVASNLAKYIGLPPLDEKESMPFTSEEVQKIWTAYGSGNMVAASMLVMIYSGMMPGELLTLRKDMVDLERCEIIGVGKKTKIRKESVLMFADCVKPVLSALMDASPSEKVINQPRNAWYKDYHEAVQAMGIRDLPPYSCRHTTGTEAARLGLNAPTIQRVMRHARIDTSQRYIHLGDDTVRNALNQMEANKNSMTNK